MAVINIISIAGLLHTPYMYKFLFLFHPLMLIPAGTYSTIKNPVGALRIWHQRCDCGRRQHPTPPSLRQMQRKSDFPNPSHTDSVAKPPRDRNR
jgi:hypothetical protein